MRRAVERLAAERADEPAPIDDSETLPRLIQDTHATARNIEAIAGSAAGNQRCPSHGPNDSRGGPERPDGVWPVGARARQRDARDLGGAGGRQRRWRATAALTGVREARVQNRIVAGAIVAGALLWTNAGGVMLRDAPEGWQWPRESGGKVGEAADVGGRSAVDAHGIAG